MNSGATATPDDVADRSTSTGRAAAPPGDEVSEAKTAGEVTTTETAGSAAGDLPLDQVFTVLKNQRRRRVLAFLREEGGPVSISDLSEWIAAKENDKPVAELRSQERKRVYVGLYQCHLPMMDDAGIVDFDKDRGFVELEELAATLDPYLAAPTAPPTPWHAYYLVLAVLGGLAAVASVAVPALPAVLIAVAQATAFGGAALLHGWREGALGRVH